MRSAEQTARLLPRGVSEACAVRPLPVLPARAGQLASPAKPFHRVTPVYPKEQLEGRDQAVVIFEAEVTEHGTLTGFRHKSPADVADEFRLASQLAAGLWRFEPGRTGTCPARIAATFSMQFTLK